MTGEARGETITRGAKKLVGQHNGRHPPHVSNNRTDITDRKRWG